jgi:uncharacterized protein (DUF305 family)
LEVPVNGPSVRSALVALLAGAALLTGATACGADAATPSGGAPDTAAFNDTDVMFLQMSLEHIRQGSPVLRLAMDRAGNAELRDLATTMDTEWEGQADTMATWLTGWGRPLTADPDAGLHAGHGDLHSLRPQDVAELRRATTADFDRSALSMLVGHLHNGVEVARLEASAGLNPRVRDLAAAMTTTRQAQIRTMLTLIS